MYLNQPSLKISTQYSIIKNKNTSKYFHKNLHTYKHQFNTRGNRFKKKKFPYTLKKIQF